MYLPLSLRQVKEMSITVRMMDSHLPINLDTPVVTQAVDLMKMTKVMKGTTKMTLHHLRRRRKLSNAVVRAPNELKNLEKDVDLAGKDQHQLHSQLISSQLSYK
jgi:hypothetical protein